MIRGENTYIPKIMRWKKDYQSSDRQESLPLNLFLILTDIYERDYP